MRCIVILSIDTILSYLWLNCITRGIASSDPLENWADMSRAATNRFGLYLSFLTVVAAHDESFLAPFWVQSHYLPFWVMYSSPLKHSMIVTCCHQKKKIEITSFYYLFLFCYYWNSFLKQVLKCCFKRSSNAGLRTNTYHLAQAESLTRSL